VVAHRHGRVRLCKRQRLKKPKWAEGQDEAAAAIGAMTMRSHAESHCKEGGVVCSAQNLSPVVTMIVVAPKVAPRVVPIGVVATSVVVGPPPAPVGTANPMYLLHTRNRVCRDWCDWHCRCGGRCKAATKCSRRKNQFDVGHGHHSSVDAPLTRDTAGSFWPDWVN
jgi:hypothetical protein